MSIEWGNRFANGEVNPARSEKAARRRISQCPFKPGEGRWDTWADTEVVFREIGEWTPLGGSDERAAE